MLDPYIFLLAKIAIGIFRTNYSASDRLIMELVLFESINKVEMVDAAPYEDKAIISLDLFFVRLSLYAVNGEQVPARHRAVYVWSAALLLTYLSGVSEITKRNIMAEAVPFVFLVMMKDINKPGLDTSEGSEHTFCILRTMI